MFDILGMVAALRRPMLLVRSARFGVDDYRRTHHLQRILKSAALPRPGEALVKLMEIEADLNRLRLDERAEYSFARHIDVLIAIMGEARLLKSTTAPRLV